MPSLCPLWINGTCVLLRGVHRKRDWESCRSRCPPRAGRGKPGSCLPCAELGDTSRDRSVKLRGKWWSHCPSPAGEEPLMSQLSGRCPWRWGFLSCLSPAAASGRTQRVAGICCSPLACLCRKGIFVSLLSFLGAGWWQQKEGSYCKCNAYAAFGWSPWGECASRAPPLPAVRLQLAEGSCWPCFDASGVPQRRMHVGLLLGAHPRAGGSFIVPSCWSRTPCRCTTWSCALARGGCGWSCRWSGRGGVGFASFGCCSGRNKILSLKTRGVCCPCKLQILTWPPFACEEC